MYDEGDVIREKVVLIYTFLRPACFVKELPRLRSFLHRLERKTNQGEVAYQLDSTFYRITEFDET